MKPMLLVLPVIFVISGCADTYTSSGVIPQADTFIIILKSNHSRIFEHYRHDAYSYDEQIKTEVYKEAADYCASINKQLQSISDKGGTLNNGRSYIQLQFRCLSNGDPESGTPTSQ
jgi:hypothetical protein